MCRVSCVPQAREYARGEVAVRRADWGGASLAGFLALNRPPGDGHAALLEGVNGTGMWGNWELPIPN